MSRDKAGNLAVSDEYTFTTIGAPAAFSLSALEITPTEVDIGERVDISVLITNSGDATGSYEVILKINDVVVDTKGVTLTGGANQRVTFTTLKDTAETVTVDVNGFIGSFVVRDTLTKETNAGEESYPAEVEESHPITVKESYPTAVKESYPTAIEKEPTVTSPPTTPVYSWRVLGQIIGFAFIFIGITSFTVIFLQRRVLRHLGQR
jgi:hypothetical protein